MELFIMPLFHTFLFILSFMVYDTYGIFAICAIIAQLLLRKNFIKRQIEQFNEKALIRYAAEWGINIVYILTAGEKIFLLKNGNIIDDLFTLMNSPICTVYYTCENLKNILDALAVDYNVFSKCVALILSSIMIVICIHQYIRLAEQFV